MAALATLSAACSRVFKLFGAANGLENHANLYILAGVPPGSGKTCVDTIVRPLLSATDEPVRNEVNPTPIAILKRDRTHTLGRLNALLKCVNRRVAGTNYSKEDQEIQNLQQRLGDLRLKIDAHFASSPALIATHDLSEAVGALTFIYGASPAFYTADEDEIRRVFGGVHRPIDKPDFDLLLAGHTGSPVRIIRKDRAPFLFSTPCLTLMPLVHPAFLRELFTDRDAVRRGLLTRTLCFTCAESPREDDGAVAILDPATLAAWETRVQTILAARQQLDPDSPFVFRCSADAREVFRSYHNEIVKLRTGDFADLQEELAFSRENACRIALALLIGDRLDTGELSAEVAERAVSIARWAQFSTLTLLDAGRQAERTNHADRLHQLLTANGGELTVRRLERHHGISKPRTNALCRMYPNTFAFEVKDTGGRPSPVIRLVPAPTPTPTVKSQI
jgi:hypothetical protein